METRTNKLELDLLNGLAYNFNKIDSFAEGIDNKLSAGDSGIKPTWSVWEEFDQRGHNVGWRATGDGSTDVTLDIQRVIDSAPDGSTIFFPKGDYVLSKQNVTSINWEGIYVAYCILVENRKNLKFIFSANANLLVPTGSNDTIASGIVFKNCEGIKVCGAGGLTNDQTIKNLYNGALLLMTECSDMLIEKTYSFNLMHNTVSISSSNVTIKDSFSHKDRTGQSGAHFGLYNTNDSIIENCICYGGTNDGDIGIFGTCDRNKVINCQTHNYLYKDAARNMLGKDAQGIYVDSGTTNCSIINNYSYGYYYGIDVKTNAENTLVQGNHIQNCMVGIAGRLGEGNQALNNILIKDNIINPNGGNGASGFNMQGISVPLGIFLQATHGISVDGNYVGNSIYTNATNNFVGVLISSGSPNNGTSAPCSIVNNSFSNENRIGPFSGVSDKSFIVIKNTIYVNITSNSFDSFYGGTDSSPILDIQNSKGINIISNTFTKITGGYAIDSKNSQQINITGNMWNEHRGILKCTSCKSVAFNSNSQLESGAGVDVSDILLIDTELISINNNIKYYNGAGYTDGAYLKMQGASDYLICTGNILDMVNKGHQNWYELTGDNNLINNNLIK